MTGYSLEQEGNFFIPCSCVFYTSKLFKGLTEEVI